MRKRFADLAVGERILVGFGVFAGLMLLVVGYGLVSLARMDEAETNLVRMTDTRKAARSLNVDVLRIIVTLQYYVDSRDASLIPEFAEARRRADSLRAEIRRLSDIPATLAALDSYEQLLPQRRELADRLIAGVDTGAQAETITRLLAERRTLDDQARRQLRTIIDEQDAAAVRQQQLTHERSYRVRRNMAVLTAAAVIIMVVLTTLITRSITRPIRKLQRMTEQVGKGNFAIQNDVDTQDEIGAFARALNAMAADVARLDAAKDEFIGLASHQLRTPATAVKNFIGLLREGYAGEMTPEQKSYVDYAWESNEQQLEVVDALLSVARSESGRVTLNRRRVDLVALTRRVVDQQAATISARTQRLRVCAATPSVHVSADEEYLQMAIENLVSNASKYTRPGGRIVVALRRDARHACISVRDSGVGIAGGDLPRLFGKFSRIHNDLSTEVGGNGIGLYLSRRIVDMHGGAIAVASIPGEGSTFTIKLPAGAE